MRNNSRSALSIVFIFFITYLFNGCSSAPAVQTKPVDTNDISGVEIKDKITQKEYIKKSSLGSATFKTDESHSVKKEFLADGKSLIMELVDQSGTKWSLMIPEDALLNPETITMTALSDISSITFPGKLTAGVRFEPDGLQFQKPAVLTVSGKGLTSKSLIFQGNNDGSQIDYAYLNKAEDSAISSYVFHFSTAFAAPEPNIKDLQEKALSDYNEAIKAAKELYKKPLEVSAPPSFDYRCKSKEDIQKEPVEDYIKLIKNPEADVMRRIFDAKRTLLLLGVDEADLDCQGYIQSLVNRQLKKVNYLIKNYKYQYDKFLYVISTLLSVVHEGALLNCIDEAGQKAYLSTVYEWCLKTREYYLSELRKNADFKSFPAVINFSRYAGNLGLLDSDQVMRELKDAMSFQLTFEAESTTTNDSYYIHGEVPIELDDTLTLLGTGTGYYDNYVSYSTTETIKYTGPATFKVNVTIENFKPCEGSIDVLLDKLGSEKESFAITDNYDGDTYTNDYNSAANQEDPTAQTEFVAGFYDRFDNTTGCFKFQLHLNNGLDNAVDETITEDDGDGGITKIHLKLIHKPK